MWLWLSEEVRAQPKIFPTLTFLHNALQWHGEGGNPSSRYFCCLSSLFPITKSWRIPPVFFCPAASDFSVFPSSSGRFKILTVPHSYTIYLWMYALGLLLVESNTLREFTANNSPVYLHYLVDNTYTSFTLLYATVSDTSYARFYYSRRRSEVTTFKKQARRFLAFSDNPHGEIFVILPRLFSKCQGDLELVKNAPMRRDARSLKVSPIKHITYRRI